MSRQSQLLVFFPKQKKHYLKGIYMLHRRVSSSVFILLLLHQDFLLKCIKHTVLLKFFQQNTDKKMQVL